MSFLSSSYWTIPSKFNGYKKQIVTRFHRVTRLKINRWNFRQCSVTVGQKAERRKRAIAWIRWIYRRSNSVHLTELHFEALNSNKIKWKWIEAECLSNNHIIMIEAKASKVLLDIPSINPLNLLSKDRKSENVCKTRIFDETETMKMQ